MKIKNLLIAGVLGVSMCATGLVLTGCGEKKVTDIDIIGDLPILAQSETPDYSNVRAKITFDDGSEKEVDANSLRFSTVDTSTFGQKDIVISYKDSKYKLETTIDVYAPATALTATIEAYTGAYDGLSHNAISVTNATAGVQIYYSVDDKATWETTVPTIQNVGSLEVYVKLVKAYHYDFISPAYTATVSKVATEISAPTASSAPLTYNGETQNFEVVGFDAEKMQYADVNALSGKDAGTYEVVVQIKNTEDYKFPNNQTSVTLEFTIGQKEIDVQWSNEALTYNGEEQAPTATATGLVGGDVCNIVVSGAQIDAGTDYTATAESLSNENYKLPESGLETTFSIAKATNEWVTEPTISGVIGSAATPIGEAKFGTITYTYKGFDEEDTTYAASVPQEEGHFIMKAVVEGNDNYTGLETTYEFYIYSDATIAIFTSEVLNTFNTNKVGGEGQSKFLVGGKTMLAGDDNAFDLQLSAEDDMGDPVNIFRTEITMQIKNGASFEDIQDLATYATIDTTENTIDFTETAIGETFKITAIPVGVSASSGILPIEYVVEVVDGYNAYTAKDLSVITNISGNGWAQWKTENGYANISANAVILQNNISVTDSDIPSEYFWGENHGIASGVTNQTIKGSLIDAADEGIYYRELAANQTFDIYGNYFTIDYSGLSKCVVETGETLGVIVNDQEQTQERAITTHLTLLRVQGSAESATFNMSDVHFIGNGARTDRAINSGGIMIGKLLYVNTEIDNCRFIDAFIGFMFEAGSDFSLNQTNKLTNTKGYNSYNTLLYIQGVENLIIENGEYIGAGGPVMIVDHKGGETNGTGGYVSNVTAINAKLESFVKGSEPWFIGYGADAVVPGITAANAYYTQAGATFLTTQNGVENLMNMIVVFKSSSAAGLTSYTVRGSVAIYDSREEYESQSTTKTKYILDMTTYSAAAKAQSANLMENGSNGVILGTVQDASYAAVATEGSTYLNLYTSMGMGAVLGLYSANS